MTDERNVSGAGWRFEVVFMLLVLCYVAIGCESKQKRAQHELEVGNSEYRNANYEIAIQHWKRALEIDPNSAAVRIALIHASMPSNSTEARQFAVESIQRFEQALRSNANQPDLIKAVAYLHYQLGNFREAKTSYVKAMKLAPRDPETYYGVGAIDWSECYQFRMTRRRELKVRESASLITSRACGEVRSHNLATVDEGIMMLDKAVQLRPDYLDAIAFLSLSYRERADIECNDHSGNENDLKMADHWTERFVAVEKEKMSGVSLK